MIIPSASLARSHDDRLDIRGPLMPKRLHPPFVTGCTDVNMDIKLFIKMSLWISPLE